MKNPFPFFRSPAAKGMIPPQPEPLSEPQPIQNNTPHKTAQQPADSFTEWLRSQVRGGIERRERTELYEAYSVYGADGDRLVCRYYHRYPEHERDFSLSYSRVLGFDDFNRRLLEELDKSGLSPDEYRDCIQRAEALTGAPADGGARYGGFSPEETDALRAFCEETDTLTDKEYRTVSGCLNCSCRSVVGESALMLRFRKLLPHDALYRETAGIERQPIEGYDIDDLWMMGVYNRLRDKSASCRVTRLTSRWSLKKEAVLLMTAEGFPSVDGTLLLAVADTAVMSRFGVFSLDFMGK